MAVVSEEGRLHAAWGRMPAVEEKDLHADLGSAESEHHAILAEEPPSGQPGHGATPLR